MQKTQKIISGLILAMISGILLGGTWGWNIGKNADGFDGYYCIKDTEVIAMWNNVTASNIGITPDIMVNLTHSYLWEHTVDCRPWIEDCFITVPVEKCCYYKEKGNHDYCEISEWPVSKEWWESVTN